MCPVVAAASVVRVRLSAVFAYPWVRAEQKRDDKIRDVR
jgi:hypothetical protein